MRWPYMFSIGVLRGVRFGSVLGLAEALFGSVQYIQRPRDGGMPRQTSPPWRTIPFAKMLLCSEDLGCQRMDDSISSRPSGEYQNPFILHHGTWGVCYPAMKVGKIRNQIGSLLLGLQQGHCCTRSLARNLRCSPSKCLQQAPVTHARLSYQWLHTILSFFAN